MIIESKFHDYYDAVAKSTGVDRNIRYKRDRIELKEDERHYWWGDDSKRIIIWFCGKQYRCIRLPVPTKYQPRGPSLPARYLYSMEEFDEFVKAHCSHKEFEFYTGKRKRHPDSWKWTRRRYRDSLWCGQRDQAVKFFEKADPKFFVGPSQSAMVRTMAMLADENKSPIVTYNLDSRVTVINDELKPYEFVRMVDPYTAYQEIYMHMSNIAQPEKPIPHVSDADMIIAKGFDPRLSFRKDSSKGT